MVACSTMENKARWDQEGEVHCPSTMAVENSTESNRQAADRPWKAVDRPQKVAVAETAAAVAGRLRVLLEAGDKDRDSRWVAAAKSSLQLVHAPWLVGMQRIEPQSRHWHIHYDHS